MMSPDHDDQRGAHEVEAGARWRERAVERSTRPARVKAAERAQQFLTAAREIIQDKESIDFTVQQVVDRSGQSLRSFYQHFDGKHELLLALYEEEVGQLARRLRAATESGEPLARLEQAVRLIHVAGSTEQTSYRPIFSDFASRLIASHPEEMASASAPVFDYFISIVEDAAEAGLLRAGNPRRLAAATMQTISTAVRLTTASPRPLSVSEVWEFCLHGLVPDEVAAAHLALDTA